MKKEQNVLTENPFDHMAYRHFIDEMLSEVKSKFNVRIDKEKLLHVYAPNRISVIAIPVIEDKKKEGEWHDIAALIVEPDSSSRHSQLPAGIYLLQENGKLSRFKDDAGNIHGESLTTTIAETANIQVGWVKVEIGPKSVCIDWDGVSSSHHKCIRS